MTGSSTLRVDDDEFEYEDDIEEIPQIGGSSAISDDDEFEF
jgi:hypothetical protein